MDGWMDGWMDVFLVDGIYRINDDDEF